MHTVEQWLDRARSSYRAGDDAGARAAYLELLKLDPSDSRALSELGALALTGGHRSAARTAYLQAVKCHPSSAAALIEIGNLELRDNAAAPAREYFEAALRLDASVPEAHQGLARALTMLGESEAAEPHFKEGFSGHAIVHVPHRGEGESVRVLLLVSTRFGNVDTGAFLNDRLFEVFVIYVEYFDATQPLPIHGVVFNAIGDADLCADALRAAQKVVALSGAPIINAPREVLKSTRLENARRFANLAGLVTPTTSRIRRTELAERLTETKWQFPLLIRSPGFHMGSHFIRLEEAGDALARAADLPGEELLLMQFLDASSSDGMYRKYRIMIIGGEIYPLHLAISRDWKVHYFSAAMATEPAFREEERRFLTDMASVLGEAALQSLQRLAAELALDYAGVDFGLHTDGTVLVFEANATMVIALPPPDPIWDYRRAPVERARVAAAELVLARARVGIQGQPSR